ANHRAAEHVLAIELRRRAVSHAASSAATRVLAHARTSSKKLWWMANSKSEHLSLPSPSAGCTYLHLRIQKPRLRSTRCRTVGSITSLSPDTFAGSFVSRKTASAPG